MKIQRLFFLFLVCCCFFSMYSSKSHKDQQPTFTIYTSKDLESLHAPIIFSSSGIKKFLSNTFNKAKYAQEILPNDFSHLLQCLEHGNRGSKKQTYTRSILRLFTNKLKACPYVSAYAFSDMLDGIADVLVPNSQTELKKIDGLKEPIYDLLYSSFAKKFSRFKKQPRAFLDNLSDQIIEQLNDYYVPNTDSEELRAQTIRFLEIGLSKLVWHPEEREQTWQLVKKIGDQLAELVNKDIVNDVEDLNDLYISLLERYIFFLDISSDELTALFYKNIKEDIANDLPLLLELEEQEVYLEPKSQRLMRVLNIGEAKARSREFTKSQ